MEPSRSPFTTGASSRYNARTDFASRRNSLIPKRTTEVRPRPARDEVDVIAKAIEGIPFVGPLWADVLQLAFGVADAMNLQRLRIDPPLAARERKVVFLY